MQLTPRYGSDPVIVLDGPPPAISMPARRQYARLAATLATFSDDDWAHPSRCAGWSNRDVIVHLTSATTFWSFTIGAGLRGKPTEFLATFDPVSSPAELVAAAPDVPASVVLAQFVTAVHALDELLASLDGDGGDGWSALAEAPPGHVTIAALMHHALWDSWVHERDVLIPLGRTPVVEPDEVAESLRYVAALGPALARNRGVDRAGTFAVRVDDPDLAFVVELGDRITVRDGTAGTGPVLAGDAVELLEAFSVRRPFDPTAIAEDDRWMFAGLAETFDVISS